MKILAKSGPFYDDIIEKYKKDCSNIEIQLLNFLSDKDILDYFNNITKTKSNIYVIHMPLIKEVDLNLEYFTYPKYKETFLRVCKLSQMLANYYKHDITIIIHNGSTLDFYEKIPKLLECIIDLFNNVLSKFKNISFAIENIIPFIIKDNNLIESTNGYLNENVIIAKYLNKVCIKKAFGTVLDTCHAMITIKLIKKLFDNKNYLDYDEYNLESFFHQNRDTIKVIHLSNVKEFGYNKFEHGTPFLDEDMDQLSKIVDLYKKYNYDCFVTIEVFEKDYLNRINFEKTRDNLLKLI
jgi:hypothetical protein